MGSDKLLLISGDGHVALPQPEYRPYLESRYHEAFDETLGDQGAMGAEIDFFGILTDGVAARHKKIYYDSGAIAAAPTATVGSRNSNKDGVAGEVLFPDGAPFSAAAIGAPCESHLLLGARVRWCPGLQPIHRRLRLALLRPLRRTSDPVGSECGRSRKRCAVGGGTRP